MAIYSPNITKFLKNSESNENIPVSEIPPLEPVQLKQKFEEYCKHKCCSDHTVLHYPETYFDKFTSNNKNLILRDNTYYLKVSIYSHNMCICIKYTVEYFTKSIIIDLIEYSDNDNGNYDSYIQKYMGLCSREVWINEHEFISHLLDGYRRCKFNSQGEYTEKFEYSLITTHKNQIISKEFYITENNKILNMMCRNDYVNITLRERLFCAYEYNEEFKWLFSLKKWRDFINEYLYTLMDLPLEIINLCFSYLEENQRSIEGIKYLGHRIDQIEKKLNSESLRNSIYP